MSDRVLGCGDTARCSRGVGKVAQSRGGLGAEGGVGVRQAGTARTQRGRRGRLPHPPPASVSAQSPIPHEAYGDLPRPPPPFLLLCTDMHKQSHTLTESHTVSRAESRTDFQVLPTTTPPQELRAPLTAALLRRRGNETFSERRETQTEQRLGNHSAVLPRALLNLQLQGRPKAPGSPTPGAVGE